jgi:hypothetical protein
LAIEVNLPITYSGEARKNLELDYFFVKEKSFIRYPGYYTLDKAESVPSTIYSYETITFDGTLLHGMLT